MKDRLYVSAADSPARRSAQSTLWDLLTGLTLAMAPILSFTAEEIWEYIPGRDKAASVHLAALPEAPPGFPDEALLAKYEFLLKVRGAINRSLEEARKAKRISTAQETRVTLGAMGELHDQLDGRQEEIRVLAQVADLELTRAPAGVESLEVEGLWILVEPAAGAKCVRCWFTFPLVGEDPKHPELCHRCRAVLEP